MILRSLRVHHNSYPDKAGISFLLQHVAESIAPLYYFLGNNSQKWASNVTAYEELYFNNVYNNIDVKYYSNNGLFKYDFIIKKEGDYNAILLNYKCVDSLYLKNEKLYIKTTVGTITESIPEAY